MNGAIATGVTGLPAACRWAAVRSELAGFMAERLA